MTFFKLLFAAASMIFRPVTVLPVNATYASNRLLAALSRCDELRTSCPSLKGQVFSTSPFVHSRRFERV